MRSGSRTDPDDDRFQEPVRGHGQREDSNAATPPSPSAVAAQGGAAADASSPSPPPAAPGVRFREQAGGGNRGTHGSSSAAAGVDRKGKGPAADADIPFLAPIYEESSSSTTSPDSAWPLGAGADCKELFEQLVREAAVHKQKKKPEEEEEEQVKSSPPKKSPWSKFKSYFTRKTKIVHREGWQIHSEHVGHQALPITEAGNRYRGTKDRPIRVNLDAYSRIRPVLGDGECFYRSFIFSYLEQVLDREDTYEEHRLLHTIERVSTEHTNLGWNSDFGRSYKAFKKLIKKVMKWKRQGRQNNIASTNSYRKEKLLEFFSAYDTTNDIFVFLRLVVAIHICSHSHQYGEIIPGIGENYSLKDWCFQCVTSSREFTDHVMMRALASALEVPLRLERLYGGGSAEDNIYTGPGVVSVTLLYTGNHFDIIYPRAPSAESSSQQASQKEHPAG